MTEQVVRTVPGSECRPTRLRPGGSWRCPGVWQLLESGDHDEGARKGTARGGCSRQAKGLTMETGPRTPLTEAPQRWVCPSQQ